MAEGPKDIAVRAAQGSCYWLSVKIVEESLEAWEEAGSLSPCLLDEEFSFGRVCRGAGGRAGMVLTSRIESLWGICCVVSAGLGLRTVARTWPLRGQQPQPRGTGYHSPIAPFWGTLPFMK